MCTVSNVGDNFGRDYWPKKYPEIFPNKMPDLSQILIPPQVKREEFDALKKEVEALKKLLKAAKIFDEETGQPDCSMDEKVVILKRVAQLVGVDLSEIFPAAKPKAKPKPKGRGK